MNTLCLTAYIRSYIHVYFYTCLQISTGHQDYMPLKKIYIFKFVHFKVHTPVRKLFNHTIFSSTARKTEYDIKNNKVDQANLNEYLLFV